MINPSRRSLIIGIGASLIGAPAIVRASSLMKVKPLYPSLGADLLHNNLAIKVQPADLLWLPGVKGYKVGDIIHLDPPQSWGMHQGGLWKVVESLGGRATEGSFLERVT